MKPVRLEIEAFGPYGDRSEVDFSGLSQVGLFVVSGPTGAGKSSIFDAMCFALYGSLLGSREGHVDVRSDYADPSADCQVWFEFEVGGERWRVWRRPAQKRAKVRGPGLTERPADASLERWDGSQWVPKAAKIRDVNAACLELVGLSLQQFQRVVLLPQGKFSEVLNAKSDQRADLLRTLFGSEIFDRTAEILKAKAKGLEQAAAVVKERRGYFVDRAVGQLGKAEQVAADALQALASTGSELDSESAKVVEEVELEDQEKRKPEEGPHPTDQQRLDLGELAGVEGLSADGLRAHLLWITQGPFAALEAISQRLRRVSASAETAFGTASSQVAGVRERQALHKRLLELQTKEAAEAQRRKRIQLAERVAGFAEAAIRANKAQDSLAELSAQRSSAWNQAARAGAAVGLDLPKAGAEVQVAQTKALVKKLHLRQQELRQFGESLGRVRAIRHEVEELQAKQEVFETEEAASISQAAKRRELLAKLEADVLETSRVAAVLEANTKNHEELLAMVSPHTLAAQCRAEMEALATKEVALDLEQTNLNAQLAVAKTELAKLGELAALAPIRKADLATATTQLATKTKIQKATKEAALAKTDLEAASGAAEEIFGQFVSGAAPRLAEQLQPGQPCPVCGSEQHPALADSADPSPGGSVRVADVELATELANKAQAQLGRARSKLSTLLEDSEDIASTSVDQLKEAITESQAKLEESTASLADAQVIETLSAKAQARLVHLDATLGELRIGLASQREQSAKLAGELGEASKWSRDQLQTRVLAAGGLVAKAGAAVARLEELAATRQALESEGAKSELNDKGRAAKLVSLATSMKEKAALASEIEAPVLVALGGRSAQKLSEELDLALEAMDGFAEASAKCNEARRVHETSQAECNTQLSQSGFESQREASESIIPASQLTIERGLLGQFEGELAKVTAGLEALTKQKLPAEIPDLRELEAAAKEAVQLFNQAETQRVQVAQLLSDGGAALDEVAKLDDGSAQAIKDHELAALVAGVVRGDNSRRMSLETWVLAAYLRDVVEHANLHLHTMSSGRYQLVVLDQAANQRGRHGLDLAVEDSFSGAVRSTVALSGGETFQASLSLALGLADVVCRGRAGLQLDALFVDEGFGSLDEDSIDQAITVLDGLRSRGSMIGVITHVPAMKAALPVAIEVVPRADRRGSEIVQAA